VSVSSKDKCFGVARVLITANQIKTRTKELAAELDAHFGDDVPIMVGVLNGAVMFMVDLAREMSIPVTIDFMAVSSYGSSTKSSGVVKIIKDLDAPLEGRRLLVVEDIVDSGLTLEYLLDHLRRRNPADITVVSLLKKNKPDAIKVQTDLIGFEIPDEFVIGYGLDYAEKYRNLPYVGILDPSIIKVE